MFQDMVVRAGDLIAGVLDTLDPDAVSGSGARELWSAFDRAERLSAAGKTLLARRVAETHRPDRSGYPFGQRGVGPQGRHLGRGGQRRDGHLGTVAGTAGAGQGPAPR